MARASSSLLAATALLTRAREAWSGTIVLIFQPGEEVAAGGFPKLINDDHTAARIVTAFDAYWGEGSVGEGETIMASEDFGILGEAIGVPSCFWTVGGTDSELHATAEADGTLAESVPGNHLPFFAPVMEPTLSPMVEAAVVGMLTFLNDEPRAPTT